MSRSAQAKSALFFLAACLRPVCYSGFGLAIGWLVVCSLSEASPYGDLAVSRFQYSVMLLTAVVTGGALTVVDLRKCRLCCGPIATMAVAVLVIFSAFLGLAIALGGLHRVPESLRTVANGAVVIGCLLAGFAILLPLAGLQRPAVCKVVGFVVGVMIMLSAPVLLEMA